jgi:Protein of unknown function (DUF4065)
MMANQKLNNTVHFIISRCQPSELGATKLNKILWYSDLVHFEKFGSTITSDDYVKRQFGPVPKHVPISIRELEANDKIATREIEIFGKPKREYWSLNEPDISSFSPHEISILDSTIDWICTSHTAQSISDHTHDLLWESAEIGEVIPFGAALAYRAAEITPDDISWAIEELKKVS